MRWVLDRRAQPSENNGTLTIAGERGEVLKAAVEHAVPSRGHTDSEERRSAIESARARAAAARLDKKYPSAAASLREGLEVMFTDSPASASTAASPRR